MAKLSKKEAEQQQLQVKNRYWQNELESLGIEPKQKTELNDEEELEKLADIIKQAMFQDYRVAYSEKGYAHRIGAVLTRIHCYCWITIKSYCPDFAIFRFV